MNYERMNDELTAKIAALEAAEPECTCEQTNVDVFDPRGCDLCYSQSSWNREMRRLEGELEDVADMIAYQRSGEGAWIEEEVA
jgi:hypothetical protein